MKKEFLLMLGCIFALMLCSAQTVEVESFSPYKKIKMDTTITIDAASGRSDTSVGYFVDEKIFMSYEMDFVEKHADLKYDISGYAMKRVTSEKNGIEESEEVVYRNNRIVDRHITRYIGETVRSELLYSDKYGENNPLISLSIYGKDKKSGVITSYYMLYLKNVDLYIVKNDEDRKSEYESYEPSEYDLEKLFNSKVDSLRKVYPQVDWDRLIGE